MNAYTLAENLLADARKLGLINPVTNEGSPTVDMIADAFLENPGRGFPSVSREALARLVESIRERRDAGRKKYGTTMERDDLSVLQWLQHLQEELTDGAIYAEKLKDRGDSTEEIEERVISAFLGAPRTAPKGAFEWHIQSIQRDLIRGALLVEQLKQLHQGTK